ncbi:hypothetical protein RvY_08498 [Ramazzottius varieornatus]|uniref:Uncharacterized protein n=1 Tax=Ramazzottius varieornatus TaxID=947166 RepID=A0A1D1V602_RAMVA|nr:hypothetical protein RvY_08498 [Ramazzottius varieornatus]
MNSDVENTELDPGNEPPSSAVVRAKPDEILLHYVRLYHLSNLSLNADDSLGFLDCMGAYSAIVLNLKPASIYVHTSAPWFWPFANCEILLNITIDWTSVELINAPLHVNASGKRIEKIEHEADLRKLKAVEEYGGISMDFDVLTLKGCQTPHSRYPQLILKESYETNFIPNCWVCNSGVLPWQILARHNDTVVILDD